MPDRTDPFEEIEQLFEEFVTMRPSAGRNPAVDVVEQEDAVVVLADLPGRDVEGIDVTLKEGRQLTVSADGDAPELDGRYVTRERAAGAVSRSLTLPAEVDESGTDASYDDGVLTVTLPKQTEDEGTEIPVE